MFRRILLAFNVFAAAIFTLLAVELASAGRYDGAAYFLFVACLNALGPILHLMGGDQEPKELGDE